MRKFLRKTSFLLLTLVLCGTGWSVYKRSHYNLVSQMELKGIRASLAVLSDEERKALTFFLTRSLLWDEFAYPLVDSKPMSLCGYYLESEDLPERVNSRLKLSGTFMQQGFDVWKKYETLFAIEKYHLIQYPRSMIKGMVVVALIHVDLCKDIIANHFEDFQEILGTETTFGDILPIFFNPTHPKFYQLIDNERLLGILLGFGRNNAYLFEHKARERLTHLSNEWPHWPRKWRLPGFVCDSTTEETKALQKRYRKARNHIYWTYLGRDELEVTIALLTKPKNV